MAAVRCLKGCGREWARDPVLEVECPTCHAGVGARCRRPSEHVVWRGEFHADRDLLADRLGFYGECPWDCCGVHRHPKPQQLELPL